MAITAHDIVSDTPTNNFATLNPLSQSGSVISEGNLYSVIASDGYSLGTIGVNSKKWYFEYIVKDNADNNNLYLGVATSSLIKSYYRTNQGTIVISDSEVSTGLNAASTNDIISVFLDLDNNQISFYLNNTQLGSTQSLPNDTYFPYKQNANSSDPKFGYFNFGQDPTFAGAKSPTTTYTDANGIGAFYYQPPTDALALCTANLPDFTPTVTGDVAQDYFKAVIWTGDGSSSISVPVGFTPDLIWMKARNDTKHNNLWDSVRGFAPNKYLISNDIFEEGGTSAQNAGHPELDPNDSSVFLAKAGSASSVWTTTNGTNYVAWCWKAGGPPDLTSSPTKPFAKNGVQYETLSAANITAGTITPTAMSVNTDAGFSIVHFDFQATGNQTIGHGLSDELDMVIIKSRDGAHPWWVYHRSIGATNYLRLNATHQASANSGVYGTDPTSSVFTIGSLMNTSNFGTSQIAYCWHSVEGYSKCGSYVGNGSTTGDGPYVHCGFRPAFVLIKSTSTGGWSLWDSARNPHNVTDLLLQPYNANQEYQFTSYQIDLLSNGFKIKNASANTQLNASATQYIFMAFAEQPFKFSNAR